MPIFDQGYQHWEGPRRPRSLRWLTITRSGLVAGFRPRSVKLLGLASLAPALLLVIALAVWGLLEQGSSLVSFLIPLLRSLRLPTEVLEDPSLIRLPIWSLAFDRFFRIQNFLWVFLVAAIGPQLISRDLRFNALPLYLSRPLTRFDYVLGKFGMVAVVIGSVTLAPMVLAYVLGVAFSLEASVLTDTFGLLLNATLYCVLIIVIAGLLILAISSLTRNSRYTGLIWIGLWLVSDGVADVLTISVRQPWCHLVSLPKNFEAIRIHLMDADASWEKLQAVLPQTPPGGGPGGRGRNRGPFGSRPTTLPPEAMEQSEEERAIRALLQVERPDWTQSLATLLGLSAVSALILSTRIRGLDRLK
jgi:ABC-2 type transport system permease protein